MKAWAWEWIGGEDRGLSISVLGVPRTHLLPPLPSPVLSNLFEKVEHRVGKGEQVGRIEGLNIVSLLKNLPSCGTTPKNSAGRKGGGAGIYPLSHSPLPSTRPHPAHGPRRSVPWMGAAGVRAGGEHHILIARLGHRARLQGPPQDFLVKKGSYRAVFP